MTIWKWIFKIAFQIIPILIGLDWSRPKPTDYFIPPITPTPKIKPRSRYRRRRLF